MGNDDTAPQVGPSHTNVKTPPPRRRTLVCVLLDEQAAELLAALAASPAIALREASDREKLRAVLAHLAASAADGVRRPGAWERGWVEQAFGPVDENELLAPPRPCSTCGGGGWVDVEDANGDVAIAGDVCPACSADDPIPFTPTGKEPPAAGRSEVVGPGEQLCDYGRSRGERKGPCGQPAAAIDVNATPRLLCAKHAAAYARQDAANNRGPYIAAGPIPLENGGAS